MGAVAASLPSPQSEAPPAPEGLSYFVTYDVPVRLNPVRDQFREALNRNGWKRLHKSLWIADRDVRDTAIRAAEQLGLTAYVFIGTGTLLRDFARPRSTALEREIRTETRRIRRDAARRLPPAYRRWSRLTGRLRDARNVSWLDADLRAAWDAATRALRRSLASSDLRPPSRQTSKGM